MPRKKKTTTSATTAPTPITAATTAERDLYGLDSEGFEASSSEEDSEEEEEDSEEDSEDDTDGKNGGGGRKKTKRGQKKRKYRKGGTLPSRATLKRRYKADRKKYAAKMADWRDKNDTTLPMRTIVTLKELQRTGNHDLLDGDTQGIREQ